MDLPFDKIGPDVMANQRSGLLPTRLVTDHRGDKIKRSSHFHQHGRYRAPKVMRGEFVDRQLVAAHK
jgi:hypothetical protein